ncbi:DUF397 domain-containing protein [Allokutzneria sp. NRRL B-24872]|uniref:DUF397 domain-containing protein n=1 Tax=Allokutzneria sp. NRRL B-24872 TaxID=1137961 RepID=UPI000A3BCCB5|nr:DUF397 domain-containing protein [Allokutzneria sp. NRRL B-24872]
MQARPTFRPDTWRKSSRSGVNGGGDDNCVEVNFFADQPVVGIRDSKQGPDGVPLVFGPLAYTRFLAALKAGELKGC